MLQIVVWMGCVYLVVKGVTAIHMAVCSPLEGKARQNAVSNGVMILIGCCIAAVVFAFLANAQASAMPSVPSFTPTP